MQYFSIKTVNTGRKKIKFDLISVHLHNYYRNMSGFEKNIYLKKIETTCKKTPCNTHFLLCIKYFILKMLFCIIICLIWIFLMHFVIKSSEFQIILLYLLNIVNQIVTLKNILITSNVYIILRNIYVKYNKHLCLKYLNFRFRFKIFSCKN